MKEKNFEPGTTFRSPENGRSLKDYEKQLGIDKRVFEGKVIMDLGAGPTERFAKEIKEAGVNAKVVSINPDYSIKDERQKMKITAGTSDLSVAAIGQHLPFADNSFDYILSLQSVTQYIEPKEINDVIGELYRVLKSGGEARLGPFQRVSKDAEGLDEEEIGMWHQKLAYADSIGFDVSVIPFNQDSFYLGTIVLTKSGNKQKELVNSSNQQF